MSTPTRTVRLFAAAKSAADQAQVDVTGDEPLSGQLSALSGQLAELLPACSFLIAGSRYGWGELDSVDVPAGATVDVLPPFAGG